MTIQGWNYDFFFLINKMILWCTYCMKQHVVVMYIYMCVSVSLHKKMSWIAFVQQESTLV